MLKLRRALEDLKLQVKLMKTVPREVQGKTSRLFVSPVLSRQINRTQDLHHLLKHVLHVTGIDLNKYMQVSMHGDTQADKFN